MPEFRCCDQCERDGWDNGDDFSIYEGQHPGSKRGFASKRVAPPLLALSLVIKIKLK